MKQVPDSKVHGANIGPTWGQQDPGGPHVGPMNLAISVDIQNKSCQQLPGNGQWRKNTSDHAGSHQQSGCFSEPGVVVQ